MHTSLRKTSFQKFYNPASLQRTAHRASPANFRKLFASSMPGLRAIRFVQASAAPRMNASAPSMAPHHHHNQHKMLLKTSSALQKRAALASPKTQSIASAFTRIEFEEPLTSRGLSSRSVRGMSSFKHAGKAITSTAASGSLDSRKTRVLLPAGITASSVKSHFSIKEKTTFRMARQERNISSQRPTSPHILIYKFPFPAWTSITTRITGVMLSLGILDIGLVSLSDPQTLVSMAAGIKASAMLPIVKFGIAFPLIYHSLSGLRHLFWDETAKGLSLAEVNSSSQALVGASSVLSLVAAFVSF